MLADIDGLVIYQTRGQRPDAPLSAEALAAAQPIVVDGRTVGYLLSGAGQGVSALGPAEQGFLDQLRTTLLLAALAAGGLGVALGVVLSRTLSAPLARLAAGARALGDRRWDQRVPVAPGMPQEVAEVTHAFNAMAQSLAQAEDARRNLMADVAHELRTPLTVLQGNLRALLDGVYPLELREIATLYDETRLLGRLVDDLRELSLADAGRLPIAIQAVDVVALLKTTVDGFTALAEAHSVTLGLGLVEDELTARADPARITQVMHNLLANAVGHTPAGGRVTVSAGREAEQVWIDVEDTGEGIPPEALPHVFDRFYRVDPSRSRTSGGSGLGLAIAQAWARAMGGALTAASQPGLGSRFRITLPAETSLSPF
jgi:two-component system OmpR family sensor kinase/two-component system sensor histidine kinase BaeS